MYKDKSTLLYYVKFMNNVYKIGIARSTLPQRFKGCKKPEIIKLYKINCYKYNIYLTEVKW